MGKLVPVSGMMNADKYCDLIKNTAVKEMNQVHRINGGRVFQQDLAPCPTANRVKTLFEKERIKVLEWPGNSPDLNPIENLWSIIKLRLRKKDCTTLIKLIEGIIDVWY